MAKSKRTWLKITLLVLGLLVITVFIGVRFFLADYVKEKITTAVNSNSDYTLKIDKIHFNGLKVVEIYGVELIPKKTKEAFSKANKYQKDWISVKTKSIFIHGVDWIQLYKTNRFVAEKAVVEDPHFYAYRDRTSPQPPYKYRALPAEQLRDVKTACTVPLIEIKQGKITYEEVTKEGDASGKLHFSKLYGSIYHFSTEKAEWEKEPTIIVEGKASILDSIPVEITYKFNPEHDHFTFEAKVKSFTATVLNQCLNPLTKTEIESGHVNGIKLKFDADNNSAHGYLNMDYKDLRVKVLSKDEDKHKSKLKTFVANLLIHKENKPTADPADKESHGEIKFERRKDRYIFNYWWNAVKSGVVSSVAKVNIPQKTTKP